MIVTETAYPINNGYGMFHHGNYWEESNSSVDVQISIWAVIFERFPNYLKMSTKFDKMHHNFYFSLVVSKKHAIKTTNILYQSIQCYTVSIISKLLKIHFTVQLTYFTLGFIQK